MKSSQKLKSPNLRDNTPMLYADNTEVMDLKITDLLTAYIMRFNGKELRWHVRCT
jgi:hypothetical protein